MTLITNLRLCHIFSTRLSTAWAGWLHDQRRATCPYNMDNGLMQTNSEALSVLPAGA